MRAGLSPLITVRWANSTTCVCVVSTRISGAGSWATSIPAEPARRLRQRQRVRCRLRRCSSTALHLSKQIAECGCEGHVPHSEQQAQLHAIPIPLCCPIRLMFVATRQVSQRRRNSNPALRLQPLGLLLKASSEGALFLATRR